MFFSYWNFFTKSEPKPGVVTSSRHPFGNIDKILSSFLIRLAILEVSLTKLYEEQPLFEEILNYTSKNGFSIWSVDRVIGNKLTIPDYMDPKEMFDYFHSKVYGDDDDD